MSGSCSHGPILWYKYKYVIQKVNHIKDLGVTFDTNLSFQEHMQGKINKAYSLIGLIKRNFIHMDYNTFCLLYKSLVRPHLEYAHSVWYPYKKGDIVEIEKVQKRATKLIISLKTLHYKERLRKLKLPTLKYRRLRWDMIEVFIIINNMYSTVSVPLLPFAPTCYKRKFF